MIRSSITLMLFLLLTSCPSFDRQAQLAAVAKDWSTLIRASQVVPVYPLTQDLLPGDVFLVQTPLKVQRDLYKEKGYLPLDQHIGRLHPTGYSRFYGRSFHRKGAAMRNHPAGSTKQVSDVPSGFEFLKATSNGNRAKSWDDAPRAAFPSYGFSIEKGTSFQLALPVQGIPVGLGLIGSSKAVGSMTISDAYTYGVDQGSIWADFKNWWLRPSAAGGQSPSVFLTDMAGSMTRGEVTGENRLFLRIVTRVFLAREIEISMSSSRGFGAGIDAGVANPIQLIQQDLEKNEKAGQQVLYEQLLKRLNQSLTQDGKPGASLRVVAASARSISMRETFASPLVIGYLGFDIEILADGRLGNPLPTQGILEDRIKPPMALLLTADEKHVLARLQAFYEGPLDEQRVTTLLDAIDPNQAQVYRAAMRGQAVAKWSDIDKKRHRSLVKALVTAAYRGRDGGLSRLQNALTSIERNQQEDDQ